MYGTRSSLFRKQFGPKARVAHLADKSAPCRSNRFIVLSSTYDECLEITPMAVENVLPGIDDETRKARAKTSTPAREEYEVGLRTVSEDDTIRYGWKTCFTWRLESQRGRDRMEG